jgi:S-adenosylmethionine:tRNA ribosyltransferase-isomerase
METKLFQYELPEGLIAQAPLDARDASRLLFVDSRDQRIEDHQFAELPLLLQREFSQSPLIILNRSRVFRARVRFRRQSGGRGEVFLLERHGQEGKLSCLIRPQKKLRVGEILYADLAPDQDAVPVFKIESLSPPMVSVLDIPLPNILEKYGEMPLPPYIVRDPARVDRQFATMDSDRYQTLYSQEEGSVAATTAGLHFTQEIIEQCQKNGCEFATVLLHVGLGTFMPVQTDTIQEHPMHEEHYTVSSETALAIANAVNQKRPILFVGTTSLRTVESFFRFVFANQFSSETELKNLVSKTAVEGTLESKLLAFADKWLSTRLFLHPKSLEERKQPCIGHGIITNFHQPQSTLVMLIASILGYSFWRQTYDHAIAQKYRFLSYGDSSILLFNQRDLS